MADSIAAMAARKRSAPLPGPGSLQVSPEGGSGASGMAASLAKCTTGRWPPLTGRGLAPPVETWQQSNVPGNRERRRPGHFRICGACGKRNKARRAECSRCGEPLRGIPEALPGTRHSPPPPPRKYRWLVAAAVLVAIAAGVVVQRIFRTGTLGSAGQTTTNEPQAIPSSEPAARPKDDPTSAERYAQARGAVERGQRLLQRGDFRGAASLLADAVRLVPEDPRIANAYGRALLGLGSRDRALHQFERAARLDTGVPAYRLDYARALAEAGRVRE